MQSLQQTATSNSQIMIIIILILFFQIRLALQRVVSKETHEKIIGHNYRPNYRLSLKYLQITVDFFLERVFF